MQTSKWLWILGKEVVLGGAYKVVGLDIQYIGIVSSMDNDNDDLKKSTTAGCSE